MDGPGFGIYVHWPFCLAKCPYCDFNSHVRERVEHARWRAALLRELDHYADRTAGRTVTSVFFGGGTPSLMEPATVAAVIDRIAARWPLDPALEITLEANPTSVEAGRLAGFRTAGVNRVSMGVQSLRDADLKFLGRAHDREAALAAVGIAARTFDRYSFDLIYTRPGQTVADWRAELAEALEHAGEHLSLYQLTIEDGTRFATEFRRGAWHLPDDDASADLYEATQEVMAAAGRPNYEISNYARPGAECRHNLTYWRYGDYVGVGPGAHGRLTLGGAKHATYALKAPEVWLEAVERGGHGRKEETVLDPEQRGEELLMMGLRLAEGVTHERFRAESGRDMAEAVDMAAVARLAEAGFVEWDGQGLRATPAGRQRLNGVLALLVG